MSALLNLAERCERAEGPDRELDVAIYVTLYCKPTPEGYRWAGYDTPAETYPWLHPDGTPTNTDMLYTKPFTASIDAAMTLVPEGKRVTMQTRFAGWWAEVGISPGNARSAALALCAAALRARASQEPTP